MHAALAQSVERRLGKAEVGSSNLLGSLNREAFRMIPGSLFMCIRKSHRNFLLHKKALYVNHVHLVKGADCRMRPRETPACVKKGTFRFV